MAWRSSLKGRGQTNKARNQSKRRGGYYGTREKGEQNAGWKLVCGALLEEGLEVGSRK